MNKNYEIRMEAAKNAGLDTGKFFSVTLPEGLAPGSKISLVINDAGAPVFVSSDGQMTVPVDSMVEQIYANGYVKNTKLHRRFVMAQMFHMLNYRSYNGRSAGFDAALKNYPYKYTWKMVLDEVKVLAKLEKSDAEAFAERVQFFNKDVVNDMLDHYIVKVEDYIKKLPIKKCKGIPYKRIFGRDVFVSDIYSKVTNPMYTTINHVKCGRRLYVDPAGIKIQINDYQELYNRLKSFVTYSLYSLPNETQKCPAWKDAYKGSGAYYTLLNLIRFHGCCVHDQWGVVLNQYASEDYVKSKAREYKGEYWRLFAFMKKVIADNNFNFERRMKELGVRK